VDERINGTGTSEKQVERRGDKGDKTEEQKGAEASNKEGNNERAKGVTDERRTAAGTSEKGSEIQTKLPGGVNKGSGL
jgi:hypothetical protein